MKFKIRAAFLVALLAPGVTGCDGNVTGPTPPPATITTSVPPSAPAPAPVGLTPAFHVAEVTLSGVVFETTPNGRIPIAGVVVANGEGNAATTDANGFYSFGPVWVCPCAAQPWVEPGTTFLWVTKDGYTHPPGTPASVFGPGVAAPGTYDLKVDGDTRFDVELVRR